MSRFILLLLILPLFVRAQDTIYTQRDVDSFVEHQLRSKNVDKLKTMLSSDANLKGWSAYFALKGYKLFWEGKNDSAKSYADSAIQNFYKSKNSLPVNEKSLVNAYFTLGLYYRQEKKYAISNQNLLKGLNLLEKYPSQYESYLRAYLAGNHLALGNSTKALEYYHQNLRDSLYTAQARPHVVTLTRLGILYMPNYLNVKDSAYLYFKKAEKTSLVKGFENNLPFIYANLGELFKKKNQDSTLFYFKKSKASYENYIVTKNITQTNSDFDIAVNNSYVDIYENKMEKAINDLKAIIKNLEKNISNKTDRDIMLNAHDYIILAYEKLNDFKNANIYLKKKVSFEENFHQSELQSKLEKLEVAYETEKKEAQIRELELETKTKDLVIKQKRMQIYGGIAAVFLLMLATSIFYWQRGVKNKFEKILLEQRLLRSQMNPHFIFNVLQNVSIMIDSKPKIAQKMVADFGELLRLALENSREDYVYLEDEISALKRYMDLYSNTVVSFDYEIKMGATLDVQQIKVPPMLMQPLVENAIKHGIANAENKGKITIHLSEKGKDHILCEVLDNGNGFTSTKNNPNKSHRSLALQILKERLLNYGNHKSTPIQVENSTGSTCISLDIPFQKSF